MSEWGIEIYPKKVKAIVGMLLTHDIKSLKSLQAKIQAIHHFIAQLFDKYHPLNELLKNDMVLKWNEKYQNAFDDIKCYLITLLILSSPRYGIPF